MRIARIAIVSVLAATVGWLVATHTLVTYLVEASPAAARRIDPDNARLTSALATAADAAVRRARLTGEIGPAPLPSDAEMTELARTSLRSAPLNPAALRVLGDAEDAAGHADQARRMMEEAVAQSHREAIAVAWLMRDAAQTGAFEQAVQYAEALLATHTLYHRAGTEALARIAETPEGLPLVVKLLATNPVWRHSFFALLPGVTRDKQVPLAILTRLKQSAHPADIADYTPSLRAMMDQGDYARAHEIWLETLDARKRALAAGAVFDGGFEAEPNGSPFEWEVHGGAGAVAELTQGPDGFGTRALRVEFRQGRVEFGGVRQLLVLAPGRYRLQGRVRGELAGNRGLVWQVTCRSTPPAQLAGTEPIIGLKPKWGELALEFTVPAEACGAQELALVHPYRFASEQFLFGTVWFDRISITPAPDPVDGKQ